MNLKRSRIILNIITSCIIVAINIANINNLLTPPVFIVMMAIILIVFKIIGSYIIKD